ncbi:hypothetical protein FOCG_10133 [Fusarium oxysporum f. sp. radicis-lycopersici 26381]|uniref:Uncharacterized protein n=1 Tax=Fusarium oxysporum Fo47 TaxID=660027 RepID=W9LDC6_FUSOX|nr:hypothetical protein FOZG_01338 [Fusarium oxysporum Fo47]EXL50017.1 hypothetical protein FOCG_10133 [Fusarium oxysporum f. sp. radicis-lycopersici 26381]
MTRAVSSTGIQLLTRLRVKPAATLIIHLASTAFQNFPTALLLLDLIIRQRKSTRSDTSVWKNAFDPIPTVEEASTADDSHETTSDHIEYKLIVEAASSVGEEDDEVSSGQDFNEFDETIRNNSFHDTLPIQPLIDGIAV